MIVNRPCHLIKREYWRDAVDFTKFYDLHVNVGETVFAVHVKRSLRFDPESPTEGTVNS